MSTAAPTVAELDKVGRNRVTSASKYAREWKWPCPECPEVLYAIDEPTDYIVEHARDLGKAVAQEHAIFLDYFHEFIAKHMKEHAHA